MALNLLLESILNSFSKQFLIHLYLENILCKLKYGSVITINQCVQDGGPPRGARGGAPTFRGWGRSGLTFQASGCLGAGPRQYQKRQGGSVLALCRLRLINCRLIAFFSILFLLLHFYQSVFLLLQFACCKMSLHQYAYLLSCKLTFSLSGTPLQQEKQTVYKGETTALTAQLATHKSIQNRFSRQVRESIVVVGTTEKEKT